MESIFIIVEEESYARGHGNFGKRFVLSTYDGYNEKQYPAFKSKKDAEDFIKKVNPGIIPEIKEIPFDIVIPD